MGEMKEIIVVGYAYNRDLLNVLYYVKDDEYKTLKLKTKIICNRVSFRLNFRNSMPPRKFIDICLFHDTVIPYAIDTCYKLLGKITKTRITEKEIEHIFLNIKLRHTFNFSQSTQLMSEREYVLNHLDINVKHTIINRLKTLYCCHLKNGHIIPKSFSHLFLYITPVAWLTETDQSKNVSNYAKHKIVKYLLEEICPYLYVDIEDDEKLPIILAACIPLDCQELFLPPLRDPIRGYIVLKTGGRYVIFNNEEGLILKKCNTPDEVVKYCKTLHHVVTYNCRIPSIKKTIIAPRHYSAIKYISKIYDENVNSVYFKKQAVVFKSDGSSTTEHNVKYFDAVSFYSSVLIHNKGFDDDHLLQTFRLLNEFKRTSPRVKQTIVSLIGKCKHYNKRLYNLLKQYSVAYMLHVINMNRRDKCLLAVTTDGIMFKDCKSLILRKPAIIKSIRFKVESKFAWIAMQNPNCYVGYDKTTSRLIIKGFVSRSPSNNPTFFQTFIEMLFKHLIYSNNPNKNLHVFRQLLRGLERRDYVIMNPKPVTRYKPCDYFHNDLCQNVAVVFLERDENSSVLKYENIDQKSFNPSLMHVNCVYKVSWIRYYMALSRLIEKAILFYNTCFAKNNRCGLSLKMRLNRIAYEEIKLKWSKQGQSVIPGTY